LINLENLEGLNFFTEVTIKMFYFKVAGRFKKIIFFVKKK